MICANVFLRRLAAVGLVALGVGAAWAAIAVRAHGEASETAGRWASEPGLVSRVIDPARDRPSGSAAAGQPAKAAQPLRERDEPKTPTAEIPRERGREREVGRERERDRGSTKESAPRAARDDRRDRDQPEGEPEGMPAARIAPPIERGMPPRVLPLRWMLGIHGYNTDSGVFVTRVLPGSPAWRVGLERGDVIVTVGGYQVGYVDGYVYYLGDELQKRADRDGRVLLLVQNCRDLRLLNLETRLRRGPWDRPVPLRE